VGFGGLHENFSGTTPDHHQTIATVLFLEIFHVLHDLLGQFHFGTGLDMGAFKLLDIIFVKDGFHGFDLVQFRLELVQQVFFQNAGIHCGIVN